MSQDEGDLQSLLSTGFYANIAPTLSVKDRTALSSVSHGLRSLSSEYFTTYILGADGSGRSKWDSDKDWVVGWQVRLHVYTSGLVEGEGKNTHQHALTAQEKTVRGTKVGNSLNLVITFNNTGQINEYNGTIQLYDTPSSDGYQGEFRGRFVLVKTSGHRPVGSSGDIEARVKILTSS